MSDASPAVSYVQLAHEFRDSLYHDVLMLIAHQAQGYVYALQDAEVIDVDTGQAMRFAKFVVEDAVAAIEKNGGIGAPLRGAWRRFYAQDNRSVVAPW